LVRLWAINPAIGNRNMPWFQFHIGAIMRPACQSNFRASFLFQFHIGAIMSYSFT